MVASMRTKRSSEFKAKVALASIRPTIYYFLDIAREFTQKQKETLLAEAKRYPMTETYEFYIDLTNWLGEELGA